MTHGPLIIKLSGKNLSQTKLLEELMAKLSAIPAILVHGGGVEVDRLLAALSISTPKIDGLRVSSAEAMPYIAGTLAGQVRVKLQGLAQKAGVSSLGLLATDGKTLSLEPLDEKFGYVASAREGNPSFIEGLINSRILPIVSSIGLYDGIAYNINADEVARALAVMLKAPLVFVSDVPGVLDQDKNLIPAVTPALAESLIAKGTVTAGMVVKVKSALNTSAATNNRVILSSLENLVLSDLNDLNRVLGTVFSPR